MVVGGDVATLHCKRLGGGWKGDSEGTGKGRLLGGLAFGLGLAFWSRTNRDGTVVVGTTDDKPDKNLQGLMEDCNSGRMPCSWCSVSSVCFVNAGRFCWANNPGHLGTTKCGNGQRLTGLNGIGAARCRQAGVAEWIASAACPRLIISRKLGNGTPDGSDLLTRELGT